MFQKYDPKDEEAVIKLLEELTSNAFDIQQQVLEEILSKNAHTEYLQGFLNGHTDKKLFKKKVPVVNYEDIKPYIQRIANGEPSNIILAQPITEFLTSSATSGGQPKMMLSSAEDFNRRIFFSRLIMPIIKKYVDGLDQGKAMHLFFIKPEIITPSGLVARPVLTSVFNSHYFRNPPFKTYTSPDETILCLDNKQSMYCQLLCGLIQQDEVIRVGAVFASAFLRAIKFLEDYWPELCSNIRSGQVSDWIVDSGCRNAVSSLLKKPNLDLADLIENVCSGSSWEGIIKKIWPRTKFIEVIITGSMAQYIPTLEFYSGGLPLVSNGYASSECNFAINFKPLSNPYDVCYTFLPNMGYFEFLPVENNSTELSGCSGIISDQTCLDEDENSNHQLELVDLVDVKPGHCYEVVVTTYTGLYRYRVGDILMATGFHNNAPQFRFVQRRGVVLSIDTDKTNEEDLLNAVTKAKMVVESLGFLLTDYTSYADTSSIPGHYVLFWEFKTKSRNDDYSNLDRTIMEQCCLIIEGSLDSVYRRCRRRDNSIGPLEIRVVKLGTFDALMDFSLSQGSSLSQYKTPRCIKSEEAFKILESSVVGRFFSQKTPSWEPLNLGIN